MTQKSTTNEQLADMIHQHSIDDDIRFAKLATKEDIKEMKDAFDDFVTALRVFKNTSKWGYRTLLVLASVIIAVVSIGGGFKTITGWFLR